MDLISRQAAIDALRTCYDTETISMDNGDEYINYGDAVGEIEHLPSAQPDKRLEKIADLVEGTIDHFDRDDAMDLLYQIKEVLNER